MYTIMYETSRQSRFDARYWMLGAGALGQPRGMVWGGRREEGSGWGTHVYLWQIHFDIWQKQYNIVKFKKKKKKNPPYNAGDTSSIPGQGTKIPHDMEQPSPHVTAAEPTCATTREPVHHCERSPPLLRLDAAEQIKKVLTVKRERELIIESSKVTEYKSQHTNTITPLYTNKEHVETSKTHNTIYNHSKENENMYSQKYNKTHTGLVCCKLQNTNQRSLLLSCFSRVRLCETPQTAAP